MPQAQGNQAQVLLAFENDYGVIPASPKVYQMPIVTSGLSAEQSNNDDDTIRNNRNPAKPTRGNINVTGNVEFYIDAVNIGLWLKAMFNSPTTSGTGTYDHMYKIQMSQPSFIIEQGFNDVNQYFTYTGCKVSNFSVEFGGEGDVRGSIDVIGANETPNTTPLSSSPTELAYAKFSQFQAAIKEGGSAIGIIPSVSLEIDFGLQDDENNTPIGNKGVKAQLPDGIARVSGTVTAWFEDRALLDKAINGTETSLELSLDNGTDSLIFSLPEIVFERNSPTIDGPTGVMVELNYQAFYETNSDNTALKSTLTNSQASY